MHRFVYVNKAREGIEAALNAEKKYYNTRQHEPRSGFSHLGTVSVPSADERTSVSKLQDSIRLLTAMV
jgi:hypothetical protein